MQLSHTLCWHELIHGKEFPMGSIILRLNNGTELVCSEFDLTRNKKVKLYCYIPTEKKWVITYVKNEYTESMWCYFRKINRKRNKTNYSELMNHTRKHKKAGGGKISHTQTVTDYECTKEPLHDFRRVKFLIQ